MSKRVVYILLPRLSCLLAICFQQVGLLVLEGSAYEKETGLEPMQLDVLDAETEGMIGYMLEQEMQPLIPADRGMATILSQILVDPGDPAFQNPTKFM